MKKITFILLFILSVNLAFAQPANDDPAGAIALTVGVDFAANAVIGTNVAATDSEAGDATIATPTGCGMFSDSANYLGGDVWYTVVVPASGDINIETQSDAGSALTDTGLAIYTGGPGAFVFDICNDDNPGGTFFSLISLTGRTPGEMLYVRVWEYGNNTFDTFQVSAWDPAVLSVDNITIEGFSYYPNPVRDVLNLSAHKNIDALSLYSIRGQEIMKLTPGVSDLPLDMSGLPSGVYFVKVTVDKKTDTFRVLKE